jgi:hypothetical protein
MIEGVPMTVMIPDHLHDADEADEETPPVVFDGPVGTALELAELSPDDYLYAATGQVLQDHSDLVDLLADAMETAGYDETTPPAHLQFGLTLERKFQRALREGTEAAALISAVCARLRLRASGTCHCRPILIKVGRQCRVGTVQAAERATQAS